MRDKILFLPPECWKQGEGDIREHILTAKSMKDGGNDEKRQDNSKVENMERVSIDGLMTD